MWHTNEYTSLQNQINAQQKLLSYQLSWKLKLLKNEPNNYIKLSNKNHPSKDRARNLIHKEKALERWGLPTSPSRAFVAEIVEFGRRSADLRSKWDPSMERYSN